MDIRKWSSRAVFICATLLVFGAGCASTEINENDPAALYKDAQEDIDSDRYIIALEKLRTLRHKFPYSKYSALAKLRIADVYFLEESYLEAAAAYESFRDLHPKHSKSEYAMYRMAESYFLDTPSNIARDLGSATHALNAFENYLGKYRNGEFSKQARKRVGEVKDVLAHKELYIANFYYGQDNWGSAEGRYRKLIAAYPTSKYVAEAKKRLKYIEDNIPVEERDARKRKKSHADH